MEQRASSSCSCITNTDALLHDGITRDKPVLTSVNAADGGIAVLAWNDSSHTCIKIPEGSNSGIAANRKHGLRIVTLKKDCIHF